MPTCLITGGAGNLARQLTWPLAERFDRIVLLDVAAGPIGPTAPNAVFERGDLLDARSLEAVFVRHEPAAVIHLASLLSGSCEHDRGRAWQVNMDGIFGLFEAALAHGRWGRSACPSRCHPADCFLRNPPRSGEGPGNPNRAFGHPAALLGSGHAMRDRFPGVAGVSPNE